MPPKKLQNKKRQKKSINKVDNDKSSLPTINILSNDCLLKIFSYLPLEDRMRVERVCKRWQTINQHAWIDIKKLEFPKDFQRSYTKIRTCNTALQKILHRCGRSLN
ncbi:hypothetical protein PV325_011999, partial [Microctonus aethiopoides]